MTPLTQRELVVTYCQVHLHATLARAATLTRRLERQQRKQVRFAGLRFEGHRRARRRDPGRAAIIRTAESVTLLHEKKRWLAFTQLNPR